MQLNFWICCHTLNLVTTCRFNSIVLHPLTIGAFFSDHAVVSFSLNWFETQASARLISYRKLKPMELNALKYDIVNSALCRDKMTDSNGQLVGCYNSTLFSSINRHALQTKRVTNRPRIPGFNGEIKSTTDYEEYLVQLEKN